MSTTTLTVAAVFVLALPVSILAVDHVLARKYQDSWATLFGPRTAFCNNADIVASALGTSGSRARMLLGEAGAAETTTFLRNVLGRRNGWPTLGFDGDRCVYDLHREREALEQRHFGGDPDKVADTYRRVLVAAVAGEAGAYALRVGRQLREFVFSAPPVDCQPVARWHAWGNGTSHVEQLVLKFARPQVEQTLPAAPLAVVFCTGAHLLAGPLQATFVVATLFLAGWASIRRTPEDTFVRNRRRLAVLSLLSWLSAAIIVAFAHTFDRYRYVNVALPLFLATLGYTAMYLVAWIRERTAENAAGSAATCARVQSAGRPASRASSSTDQHWHHPSIRRSQEP
jgi:hypothetical protein